MNKDPGDPTVYTYRASGTAPTSITELKWDATAPTGYYVWSTSDTICALFNAYRKGVLDSVRTALRNAASISGGVYKFTGVSDPTPLGELLTPITASISTTSPVPYLVPYKSWATVDLTSMNIPTDDPFAVAFVIGSNPSVPGVMSTDHAGTTPYHSYTYLQASDDPSQGPGWYYIASSGSTVPIYLIRAYVSFATGVNPAAGSTPAAFRLYQNYPNPFNPTTVISYQLPVNSHMILKVFNGLGREVETPIDEHENAGSHFVTFDACKLVRGVFLQAASRDIQPGE